MVRHTVTVLQKQSLTDSCTLCSAKLNDTDSGSCSDTAVRHQMTCYQALLQTRDNVCCSCHGCPAVSV